MGVFSRFKRVAGPTARAKIKETFGSSTPIEEDDDVDAILAADDTPEQRMAAIRREAARRKAARQDAPTPIVAADPTPAVESSDAVQVSHGNSGKRSL